MKKFLILSLVLGVGVQIGRVVEGVSKTAAAGGGQGGGGAEKCAAKNGDVNASGSVDLSDAVTILGNLFLGSPTELPPLCAASADRGLPDTGVTRCYTDTGETDCGGFASVVCPFRGGDGSLRTGCPYDADRFTVNADDTVIDNCTGLQWQRFAADKDGDNAITAVDKFTWCEALKYCEELSFAGRTDWRLPNVRELESLIDYGRISPAIDPLFRLQGGGAGDGGGGVADTSNGFWSSTTSASQGTSAWIMDFDTGSSEGFMTKTANFFVRSVRGGL
jgi:hypothetical protein